MAYLYLVRPHARASRCTYTCATVGRAATSVEDPRTTAELEQFYGAEYPKISEREREKLARGAIKAQQTGICNLHQVRMQKRRVPVHYGLVVTDDAYYLAQLCYFPNAREYVNGGCDIPSLDVQKERAWRYVCPACKRAQKQWALAHPKVNGRKTYLRTDRSNHSMKPTAAFRHASSVIATTPCRGLSLSR